MNSKIIEVYVTLIKPSVFNPPTRTEEKNISSLVKSIKEDGFWPWCPILVDTNYVIGDGHRRFAAACAAGLDKVYAIIVEGFTAPQIWAKLNGNRRPIRSKDAAYAVTNGMDIGLIRSANPGKNHSTTGDIEKLIEWGGNELVKEILDKGASPTVASWAISVSRYCNDASNEFRVEVVRWMIKHRAQHLLRFALTYGIDPAALYTAILSDKDIVLTAGTK